MEYLPANPPQKSQSRLNRWLLNQGVPSPSELVTLVLPTDQSRRRGKSVGREVKDRLSSRYIGR